MQVKKAVFPVAGLGTRLLPVTKSHPKEMLAVVDKPLIQYAVEEAARAGITQIIFVTSTSKNGLEGYFQPDIQLENHLRKQGKNELLALLQTITPPGVQFTCVQQEQPLGLGHAVLCAEHIVDGSPFVVLLPDVLLAESHSHCLTSMCNQFDLHGKSVVAVNSVPWQEVHKYGIVSFTHLAEENSPLQTIIEKPTQEQALSNIAVLGRYLFTSEIFLCLKQIELDNRGEIQLTEAIQRLIERDRVYAHRFTGKSYDCGSKLGYLQATVEFGLQHREVGQLFGDYLREKKTDLKFPSEA